VYVALARELGDARLDRRTPEACAEPRRRSAVACGQLTRTSPSRL